MVNSITDKNYLAKILPRGWKLAVFKLWEGTTIADDYTPGSGILVDIRNDEFKANVVVSLITKKWKQGGGWENCFEVKPSVQDRESGLGKPYPGLDGSELFKDAAEAVRQLSRMASSIGDIEARKASGIKVLCKVCGTVTGALIDAGDRSVGMDSSLDWTCPICEAEPEYDEKGNPTNHEVVEPPEGHEGMSDHEYAVRKKIYEHEAKGLELKGELIRVEKALQKWTAEKQEQLAKGPEDEYGERDGWWNHLKEFDEAYAEKLLNEKGIIILRPA